MSVRGAGWGAEPAGGGAILIQSGGAVSLTGLLDADGYGPVGGGGEIQISAERLEVAGGGAPTKRITALGSVDAPNGVAPGGQVWIEAAAGV